MIHCSVTIEAYIARCGLTAGQVAVLQALWMEVRNPFADQPAVSASYEHLARRTGLKESYIGEVTVALQSAGCLRKGKSAKGRGTEYTLLRPEHSPDDVTRNPFDPSEAETATEAVVAMLRADGRTAKAEKKPKRERRTQPAIKPSELALAIEDACGYERKESGKPHNRYALGKKQLAPWIVAAQRFIDAHGRESFDRVLAAAAKRDWSDKPDHKDRIYLFETKLVDELLTASETVKLVGDYKPKSVALGLTKHGAEPDEALALVQRHWPSIATLPLDTFRDALAPWKEAPVDQRPSLASTLASIASHA